jgi:hypothetical protein
MPNRPKPLDDGESRPGRARRVQRVIDGVAHYWCGSCSEWKPVEAFAPLSNPGSRCGRRSECRRCGSRRREAFKAVERARRAAATPGA